MNKKLTTKSEKETFDLAVSMASQFKGGEIIGLIGDLGAGKTIFSKGIISGLGYNKNVSSPTFILMKIYFILSKKIKNICHIDAYRLSSYNDLLAIGANDYIGQDDTISVIEWVDRVVDFLPKSIILIKIKIRDNEREFYITGLSSDLQW